MVRKFGACVAAMGLALGGCGGAATDAADAADAAGVAESTGPAGTPLDRETVAEAIQDQMLVAIEKTYASRNAKVRLDGTVVHVNIDGDAEGAMAGFSDCRVLTQAVRDTQSVVLEYPQRHD